MSEVTGLPELSRVLKQLPPEIGQRVLNAAARAGANVVRKRASELAPVRAEAKAKRIKKGLAKGRLPGFLKANIVARRQRSGKLRAKYAVGPSRDAFYGMFIEFGTVNTSAHPFLRPAFDSTTTDAVNAMAKSAARGVERAAKKLAGSFAKSGLKSRRGRRRK